MCIGQLNLRTHENQKITEATFVHTLVSDVCKHRYTVVFCTVPISKQWHTDVCMHLYKNVVLWLIKFFKKPISDVQQDPYTGVNPTLIILCCDWPSCHFSGRLQHRTPVVTLLTKLHGRWLCLTDMRLDRTSMRPSARHDLRPGRCRPQSRPTPAMSPRRHLQRRNTATLRASHYFHLQSFRAWTIHILAAS